VNGTFNLFVYGTLRRDQRHEMFRLLARHARFIGDGTIRGKLYDLGTYPGWVPSPGGNVLGEVYAIDPEQWEGIISRLDDYEGCSASDPEPHEYRRVVVDVTLSNGQTVDAWAYRLSHQPEQSREIRSGDYLAWRDKARA